MFEQENPLIISLHSVESYDSPFRNLWSLQQMDTL